ncbi:hypothetical protein D3C77_600050 [compost metagenome]
MLQLSLDSQARNLEDQIKSQEKISRSTALKNSRQEWINNLRSEISHLLSIAHEIHALAYDVKDPRIDGETRAEIKESWKEHNAKSDKFYGLLAKARFHVSNIQMHLNPAEIDSQNLQRHIHLLVDSAFKNDRIIDHVTNIIEVSQTILKKEWVRVKEMV